MTIHETNNIHTPSTPRHLKITQTMVEDFLIDPVLGVRVIFNVSLDVFQQSALRTYWWVPDVIDSSGFGSGKSLRAWLYSNLRCLILGDQWGWAYYQTFQAGKDIFWPYYEKFNSRTAPLFAAQLGKLDEDGDTNGKDNTKGPAAYTQHFKNGSKIVLPAPGWFQSAKSQAGLTFNFAIVDEWTKVETMSKKKPGRGGRMQEYEAGGIDQQIQGRLRRECFNQFHPLWGNHCKFMATAESLQHPAARRLKAFQREIKKGNPHFAIISYCFKHFSNRRNHQGRRFRDIPNWQRIKAMKATFTPAHFLREGLGIWARDTSGIYPEESLERGVAAGIAANVQPQLGRDENWEHVLAGQVFNRITHADPFREMPQAGGTHYFMGVDPAPSQTRKADDGAMVVLRARPKPGLGRPVTASAADWETAYVWAYRVRGERHDPTDEGIDLAENNRQWSGLIHARHQRFGFSGICMDPQGGGSMVMTELNQTRQIINGADTQVVPIVTPDNLTAGVAHFILTMFRRRDSGVQALWPILQGDDSLYDNMHMTFQQAVEHGMVLWPKPFNNRDPEEYKNWPEEMKWALKNLDAAREQLSNIQAATNDDGGWLLSANNAKTYTAMGKKDLAYAAIYAYVRFLIWLKQNELEFTGEEQESSGGGFYSYEM